MTTERDNLGTLISLQVSRPSDVRSANESGIPRSVFFLADGTTVLVAFFGRRGIWCVVIQIGLQNS